MFYAYKVIDGVLHVQTMPDGPWRAMTAEQITSRLVEEQAEHDSQRETADEVLNDFAATAHEHAALLAFVEQMARMTTPEDEFAAEGEEGDELRAQYADADEYRADLDDDRLCGEFDAFMTMISEARKLLA